MKAMILAAGRGERMRHLTANCPKPLLKIGNKPLIVWHIEQLVINGIKDIIINTSYLGEMIKDELGAGKQFGANLYYSEEEERLETAGGIKKALPIIDAKHFIIVNADIWCRYPYENLNELAPDMLAHLIMVKNPSHNSNGDFSLNKNLIGNNKPKLTYSGIGLYHSDLFASITSGQKAALAPLLKEASVQQLVSGEKYEGIWMDIGTPERLQEVQTSSKNNVAKV